MTSKHDRGRPPHDDILTPAEWRIAEAIRHGMTSKMIAERRGISVDAVKFHVANILAKLGLSSRAELRRWAGIGKHSALHGRKTDMSEPITLGAIGQIARSVKDIEAATKWYRDVLALPHLYSFGDLAFFDCGGVRLFLSLEKTGEASDSILYFRVSDIHAAHAQLTARGAVFVDAPHMIHKHGDGTEEWMAFFQDNEGRPLAIMAQVKAS
jgi:DNA-binding CsgD family transcriptional regulator/catechol 2,3-dioxygenase-like lactoylglutathione lyase family enzyme